MDTESLSLLLAVLGIESQIVTAHTKFAVLISQIISAGEDPDMAVIDDLRAAAAALREHQTALDTAITSAITRLSDNPSPTDVAAVVADLTSISTAQQGSIDAVNTIDPDVPGGITPDPTDPGSVVSNP